VLDAIVADERDGRRSYALTSLRLRQMLVHTGLPSTGQQD
jgi:hypothetical protein